MSSNFPLPLGTGALVWPDKLILCRLAPIKGNPVSCSEHLVLLLLLLLFLQHHFLFYLLFVKLLRRSQVEIVYYVRDICHSIAWRVRPLWIRHLLVLVHQLISIQLPVRFILLRCALLRRLTSVSVVGIVHGHTLKPILHDFSVLVRSHALTLIPLMLSVSRILTG